MSIRAGFLAVTAALALSAAITSANAITLSTCTFNGNQTNTPQSCTDVPYLTQIDNPLNTPLQSIAAVGGTLTPLITTFQANAGDASNLGFAVDFTGENTGTWTFTPGPGLLEATILAIKAGNAWFIINVAGLLERSWNTADVLTPPGIGTSHISFYDHAGVIPIPPAALLFGGALLGLGLIRRRRKATEMAAA